MSHTITMERPFSRKARAKVNTDLTVEITDLAWTITNAALAGLRRCEAWCSLETLQLLVNKYAIKPKIRASYARRAGGPDTNHLLENRKRCCPTSYRDKSMSEE